MMYFYHLFIYLMRCFSILVSSLDIGQRMGYQTFHKISMTKFASKMQGCFPVLTEIQHNKNHSTNKVEKTVKE